MTNEELVKLYNSGDHSALERLTEQNMRLIQSIANKYYIGCNFIDNADLVQQGWIGFLRAAETYKADLPNSAKFSTWAVYWIRQAIHRYLEQKKPKLNETSLNEPIGENGEGEMVDLIPDRDDCSYENMWRRLEVLELHRELEEVMSDCLSLRQQEILKMYYGWNGSKVLLFEDIGDIFGITKQAAYSAHQGAVRDMRRSKWARKRALEQLEEKRIALQYNNPILTLKYSSDIDKLKSIMETLSIKG